MKGWIVLVHEPLNIFKKIYKIEKKKKKKKKKKKIIKNC